MLRFVKAAIWTGLLAYSTGSVAAQPVWQSYSTNEVRQGAAICPVNDTQTGNFFCFALSCPIDGPRGWTVTYVGGAMPGGDVTATLTINGTPAPPMIMQQTSRADYVQLSAPWEPNRDALLADQLAGGGAAELLLDAPNWQAGYLLPLDTAQAPLVEVLRTCPLPAPPAIIDPIEDARAEATQFCGQMSGQLQVADGFVSEPDLNGDGRADLVLNWGAFSCTSGGVSSYCGSAGCVHGMFIALEGGGYKEILETNIRGYSAQVMPVIELNLHGGSCGGVGAERCVKYFTLDQALELDELD